MIFLGKGSLETCMSNETVGKRAMTTAVPAHRAAPANVEMAAITSSAFYDSSELNVVPR